jgi:hypothetical protein
MMTEDTVAALEMAEDSGMAGPTMEASGFGWTTNKGTLTRLDQQ